MSSMTWDDLVKFAVIIMAVWGFFKVIMEIIKTLNDRHDHEQKWDNWETKFKELEGQISDNYCDTEAKIQELKTELAIQTECMLAVLDGLGQLNCNGPVTEAKNELIEYLKDKAHE